MASKKNKKSSSSSNRKGLIIWIGLTIVASAWMFILGIVVGRGTAPIRFDIEKIQKELALLKEAYLKQELSRYKIDSDVGKSHTEMEFYEALKDDKREAELKSDALKQPENSLSESARSDKNKTATPEKKKIEKVSRKSQTISSNLKAVEGKSLTIQVASLKDPKVADKMVAELKKKGYPAYRSIGKIPGKGIWYRVRVGYFKNKSEAGRMLSRLNKDNVKAIIVPR
jgi:cell division protein FtsN